MGMNLATVGRLLVIALPLYFVWEMLQAPAFTGMPDDWWAATAVCAVVTLGDAVIVLGLFGLGVLVFRDARWFVPPRLGRYAAVVLAGIGVQVAVEWVMRTDSGGGVQPQAAPRAGILPVLQAVVLLPLVFGTLARWETR